MRIRTSFLAMFLCALSCAREDAPLRLPAPSEKGFVPSTEGKKLLCYRGPVEGVDGVGFDGVIVGGEAPFNKKVDAEKLYAWAEATAKKDFGRHTDNFYLCYSWPCEEKGGFDWFGDFSWRAENWRIMAAAAKKARFKGICFDSEYYAGHPLFSYELAPQRGTKSFEEYEARVRECGAEAMRAVNKEFPDITIILLFGFSGGSYGVPQHMVSREKLYPLVSAFVDGLLSECGPDARVFDMYEQGFSFRVAGSYERARAIMKELGPERSAVPDRYRRHHKAGFSFWADCWTDAGKGRPFAVDDLEKNYYTPDEFAYSVHLALKYSDEYAWMWPGSFEWWKGTVKTVDADGKEIRKPIPEGYLKGLQRAHEPDLPAPSRDRKPNTFRNEPAKTMEGWDDEWTFGDLWKTHEFIADLPVEWRFRIDPDEVGAAEGWHKPEFDDSKWAKVKIREFWENQGFSPYDGAAWYRLNYTPPKLPEGRRIFLAFGGVSEEASVIIDGKLIYASRYGDNIRNRRFLVDVTDSLRAEGVSLVVRVWNTGWCGGIWKNVKLVAER